MENKYENKVRERAEEFAKATHPDTWKAAKESLIEQFTPAARLSVQREAEAAKSVYDLVFNSKDNIEWSWVDRDRYLQSLGLVPQKDNNGR